MRKLKHFPFKHALVLGLASSGTAAAKVLLHNHLPVRVNDFNTKATDSIVKELQNMGADVIVGGHPLTVLDNIDLIVKNPGIPYTNPILVEAEKRQIPIITEIELAARLVEDTQLIGITGSNGKTTTTTLVKEMLVCSEVPVKVGGNIGTVASEIAENITDNEKLLLELSSFQLMGVQIFKPKIAAILNLFDAHLDYHGTVDQYVLAKANVIKAQTEADYFVYNADDKRVTSLAAASKAQLIPFTLKQENRDGAWTDGQSVYFQSEKIIDLKDIVLVGEHNLQNILAAVSIAKLAGATTLGIHTVLSHFSGVAHRLQFIVNKNKRLFYNDSKATNKLATEKALQSFTRPVILLAGGLDRQENYDSLLPYLEYVKAAVLFGETKEKLKETAEKANIPVIEFAEDVKEATIQAYNLSAPGDIILLSPACASWDQYKTFEERGDLFVQTVHTLE